MYVAYQYNTNGFINARVRSMKVPSCQNQLVFTDETDPRIFGKVYLASQNKAYTVLRNEQNEPLLDGGGYVIDEESAIDLSNAITGES